MEKLGIVPEGLHGVLRVRAGEDLRPRDLLASQPAAHLVGSDVQGAGMGANALPFPETPLVLHLQLGVRRI